MLPEEIDDLFRQKLDGHAKPPGNDLWARLNLPAEDKEPLDQLFQQGLNAHATPPQRELWERLEDEYLRPQPRRKRRVAAWWQYSAAAVFLLMLLAGGAGLWRGGYLSQTGGNIAANKSGSSAGKDANGTKPTGTPQAKLPTTKERDAQLALAQPTDATPGAASLANNQKYFSSQATASLASTSNTPIATTTRPRRAATTPQVAGSHRAQGQQPDAAASQLASNGGRKTPTSQQLGSSPVAPATTTAPATRDQAEAPTLALVPSPAKADAAPEIIEVDVRRGPETSRFVAQAAPVVAAAPSQPAADQPRRRLRLGGLLRQADHLVHGEAVSLAEATGLPESLTLQARLGGRTLSKTIQL